MFVHYISTSVVYIVRCHGRILNSRDAHTFEYLDFYLVVIIHIEGRVCRQQTQTNCYHDCTCSRYCIFYITQFQKKKNNNNKIDYYYYYLNIFLSLKLLTFLKI